MKTTRILQTTLIAFTWISVSSTAFAAINAKSSGTTDSSGAASSSTNMNTNSRDNMNMDDNAHMNDNARMNNDNARINNTDPSAASTASNDQEITRSIKAKLMQEKTLSSSAKNINVNTQDNVITLRGVVNSQTEKDKVDQLAKSAWPSSTVENEIEVKSTRRY